MLTPVYRAMSQSMILGFDHRGEEGDEAELVDEGMENVFDALADGQCRLMLQELSEEPLSAAELSEECDMPQSTTYRKIDELQEAELVEERTRLGTNGNHSSEYAVTAQQIEVTVSGDGGVDLTVTTEESDEADLRSSMRQ